jgi:hypothetical protein
MRESSNFWWRNHKGVRISAVTLLVLTLICASFSVTNNNAQADPFADPAFQRTWARADLPVITGAAKRSWLYGPEAFYTSYEPYSDSPNGQRLVQYFDKARMEITNPTLNRNNQYFVTNGLLVKEMILGTLQLGDENYGTRYPAFSIPVAGDSDPVGNPDAPTYASFYLVASTQLNRGVAPRIGEAVVDVIGKNGQVSSNPALGALVRYNYYDPTTRHNVAQPFYDFITRNGTIFNGNGYTNGPILDWTYTVGFPITEAYWVVTKINGIKRDVLVQHFERRTLTYTPNNPVDFQVEMGNVGRHYFTWRYDTRYDLSVPLSSNGTITPNAGLPGAKFVIKSTFFKQDEVIQAILFGPNGTQTVLAGFDSNPPLTPVAGYLTLTLTTSAGAPLGLYQVDLTGGETGNLAKFYFMLYRIPDINSDT